MVRQNKLESAINETPEKWDWEEEHKKLKEKLDNWRWYNQLWWFLRYGLWNWIYDLKWRVPNWFERANNGWGHADTWSLDYYLSDVLRGSLRHLKKYKHGCPLILDPNTPREKWTYDEKRWDEILDTIIATFDTAKKIQESETVYLATYAYDEKEWQDLYEKYSGLHADKYDTKHPAAFPTVMTKEECEKYELGWKYFQQYYFSLWD